MASRLTEGSERGVAGSRRVDLIIELIDQALAEYEAEQASPAGHALASAASGPAVR